MAGECGLVLSAHAGDVFEHRAEDVQAVVDVDENHHWHNQQGHPHISAMPGGAGGLPLKDKTAKQSVSLDLAELRQNLTKYLDDFVKRRLAKGLPAFPNDKRPLDLKKLYLVAFVQDDETKEVLQAAQVEIQGEETETK